MCCARPDLAALVRQTNPNWRAFFFITDTVPFENRLRKILRTAGDKRLGYIAVDRAHRRAVSLKFTLCLHV